MQASSDFYAGEQVQASLAKAAAAGNEAAVTSSERGKVQKRRAGVTRRIQTV
jgi:hypothetical protein